MAEESIREQITRRLGELKQERNSFIPHWRELTDFLSPRTGKYLVIDRNKGIKANDKIINSCATTALRTLKSGMHAGMTSPARPWFRLTADDADIMKIASVKNWLFDVENRMRVVFIRSNFYMRNPVEATRFANQASDHMRNVDKSFDRDITQALNTLVGQHSVFDDIKHWSIASRIFFWKIGAVMAWHAGYIDAQEQGLQGKAAVRIADSIYRMTKESGRVGDLSAVQRNPYMNQLTQFIGPSLIQYNNNRRAVMAFEDQGFNSQTAALGLTTLLAGHVANAIIFDLLRGKQPDDLEKLPEWILARLTLGLSDGIPAMRDIAGYAESKVTGEKGKELRLPPVLQWSKDAVDGLTKAVNAAAGNVDWHKAVIQDAKEVSGATGLPTLAGSTVGQYIYDVLSGDYKSEHPWSPVTDIFYNRKKSG